MDGVDDDGPAVSNQQVKQGQSGEGTFDNVGLGAEPLLELSGRQDTDGVVREQVVAQPENQGPHCFTRRGEFPAGGYAAGRRY